MTLRTSLISLTAIALALCLPACGGEKEKAKGTSKKGATEKGASKKGATEKGSVPTETAPLALNENGNKIPATVDVPKGSTIFADKPTMLRISYGKGEAFGLQVRAGNEFNTNLAQTAKELAKNEYGNTNKIVEQTATVLRYTMSRDGRTSHKFTLLVDLAGKKWVCMQGNVGGWSAERAKAQLAACRTLKAK